jgi:hypothetical protein
MQIENKLVRNGFAHMLNCVCVCVVFFLVLQLKNSSTSATEFSSFMFLTFSWSKRQMLVGSLMMKSWGLCRGGRGFLTKAFLKMFAMSKASTSKRLPWHRASM